MALRMMSAIAQPASPALAASDGQQPPAASQAPEREKAELAERLLAAAKRCHRRFAGKAELATEAEPCVRELCSALERALGHGLRERPPGAGASGVQAALRHVSELVRPPPPPPPPQQPKQQPKQQQPKQQSPERADGRRHFWPCVREQLSWHERERFEVLRRVRSERGRGRAWLRAALNERSLEKHLHSLLGCEALLRAHYRPEALLLDPERSCLLPSVAQGLSSILFAVRVDNRELDAPDADEPIIADAELADAAPSVLQPRKKVRARVISFDEEETPAEDARAMPSLMPLSPPSEDLWLDLPGHSRARPGFLLGSIEASEAGEAAVEATEDDEHVLAAPAEALEPEPEPESEPALRLRLLALSDAVEQAREEAVASKQQLARLQRQQQSSLERHELQVQTLSRENELLRQQLRKYVTAVQLLEKKEHSPLDYHRESQQYQYKLVQVAEMHAELMEFNARLTMQLNDKDRLVKSLQTELECLRGPINDEDVPTKAPFFIHIWIPSAFLTGQTSDVHHVYQIYIRIRDTEWNIYRRYAQFYALYRELKKQDSVLTSFEFPPKKTIGNKDSRFVEDRRHRLQNWLRRVVNRLSHCSTAFSSNPTKQTLVSLLPFFGDLPPAGELRRNHSSGNTHASSSPQYMGL